MRQREVWKKAQGHLECVNTIMLALTREVKTTQHCDFFNKVFPATSQGAAEKQNTSNLDQVSNQDPEYNIFQVFLNTTPLDVHHFTEIDKLEKREKNEKKRWTTVSKEMSSYLSHSFQFPTLCYAKCGYIKIDIKVSSYSFFFSECPVGLDFRSTIGTFKMFHYFSQTFLYITLVRVVVWLSEDLIKFKWHFEFLSLQFHYFIVQVL